MSTANDSNAIPAAQRFTFDGSPELEATIDEINRRVVADIHKVISPEQIDALVLAGGYGRGEGGVYVVNNKEQLYNDLDYYLFLKGNKRANESAYGAKIKAIEAARTPEAKCDVEFKIDSLAQLEQSSVTMFSYDLVARSTIVTGEETVFQRCSKHLDARAIPQSEATRLLFNRCTGLIFARQRLSKDTLTQDDLEFVQRNLAKIELAMGDAILTVQGAYHWNGKERNQRLRKLPPVEGIQSWDSLVAAHTQGIQFKLRPSHPVESHETLSDQLTRLSLAARDVWFWVEQRRLNENISTPMEYATTSKPRCPEHPGWRNLLVNVRRRGISTLYKPYPFRYPREQLYRAMGILLWENDSWQTPSKRSLLAALFRTNPTSLEDLIQRYENDWHLFG